MKKLLTVFLVLSIAMFSVVCFAQTLPMDPAGSIDWVTLIGQMIANPKAFVGAALGAFVILLIVQGMKSDTVGKFFKFIPDQAQFLVIAVLGQVYAFLMHVYILKDQQISVVLVGLFSSGGAAAIFNGLKLAFPKFFEKKKEISA